MRILLDILRGIRAAAPELHVTVKINSSDFTWRGLDEAESLTICKALAAAGIDTIEVSGNGTSVQGIRAGVNERYFAPFAATLAEQVDVPVIAVGGWRSMERMEAALNDTKIAFLSLSRPLLREPDLPNKQQSGETNVSKCVSCNACYSSPSHRCVFRKRDLKYGNKMLPFPFMGWVECIAYTAYDWQFSGLLNNVFVEPDHDFSQCEQITHTGALLIGTYDNFTYGDPSGFLRNINDHIPTREQNKLIFIEKTGHTYQMKHQEVADDILRLVQDWRGVSHA